MLVVLSEDDSSLLSTHRRDSKPSVIPAPGGLILVSVGSRRYMHLSFVVRSPGALTKLVFGFIFISTHTPDGEKENCLLQMLNKWLLNDSAKVVSMGQGVV